MDSGNDYVIQVKRNQKKLYNELRDIILKEDCIDQYTLEETNRGRLEKRTTKIYKAHNQHILLDWKKR